jgi:hypothetical protein
VGIDTITPTSRRALLAGLVGGLTATVAGTLGRAQPASAHDPDDVRLGRLNTATRRTTITNPTENGHAIVGLASGSGIGLRGQSDSGIGVYGHGYVGVFGSSATADGVRGISDSGPALRASSVTGYGVWGNSSSVTVPAIFGWAYGNNTGLLGYSGTNGLPPASPAKTGVVGSADQDASAVGVRGSSPTGRGGRFTGKKAQIRLDPSTATTHPPRGAKGDLFVDSSGRLWFCKGGTTWKQLA